MELQQQRRQVAKAQRAQPILDASKVHGRDDLKRLTLNHQHSTRLQGHSKCPLWVDSRAIGEEKGSGGGEASQKGSHLVLTPLVPNALTSSNKNSLIRSVVEEIAQPATRAPHGR
jgi:hypothetical protein